MIFQTSKWEHKDCVYGNLSCKIYLDPLTLTEVTMVWANDNNKRTMVLSRVRITKLIWNNPRRRRTYYWMDQILTADPWDDDYWWRKIVWLRKMKMNDTWRGGKWVILSLFLSPSLEEAHPEAPATFYIAACRLRLDCCLLETNGTRKGA